MPSRMAAAEKSLINQETPLNWENSTTEVYIETNNKRHTAGQELNTSLAANEMTAKPEMTITSANSGQNICHQRRFFLREALPGL